MPKAPAIALLVTTAALGACNKESKEAPEPSAATDELPATAVERDEPADAGAKAELPELGETAHVIYRSATDETTPVVWDASGAAFTLSVATEKSQKGGTPLVSARLTAALDDGEAKDVFSCKALNPAVGGYVDVMVRGDKFHVRCVHPSQSSDPGTTEGARFGLDEETQDLVQSGSYSGEGVVDPDTIDLDEE